MVRGSVITSNLPQLLRLIKADPEAYREEFLQQWNHYNSIRQIFHMDPYEHGQRFRELVSFISRVARSYPKETEEYPAQLSLVLLEKYECLCSSTRMTLVQNLIILRKEKIVSPLFLLNSLFPLLSTTASNNFRSFIQKSIVADIRHANNPSRHHKLNGVLQSMLFDLLDRGILSRLPSGNDVPRAEIQRETSTASTDAAVWAVVTTKELWNRRIWTEPKAVSIMVISCFHSSLSVQNAAIHFFLGQDEHETDEELIEDNDQSVRKLCHRRQINKKTRSGAKKLRRDIKSVSRKRPLNVLSKARFPALQLLNDPQTFAEDLYASLLRQDKNFSLDHKILVMKLLTLVMGAHRLCVLGFYTYVLRYLTIRQLRVSAILVAVAQSIHSWTPPDVILPLIRKLAEEFVHPGVGSDVVTAGLNCIREVCKRQPCSMEEDLLGDLVEYKKSKDKNVAMAARALQQLYREVNPGLLKRSERGKGAITSTTKASYFGHTDEGAIDTGGLALLEDYMRNTHAIHSSATESITRAWQEWEVESHSSSDSDSDGWIDVNSDGAEDISFEDSETESEGKGEEKAAVRNHSEGHVNLTSRLATSKILTPADFKMLGDLQLQAARAAVEAGGGYRAKRKLAELQTARLNRYDDRRGDGVLIEEDILGPRKKARSDYAARISSIARGREGREKYCSRKGRTKNVFKNSTNREKARHKPLMMIVASGIVRKKRRASLREKRIKLQKIAYRNRI